MTSHEDEYRALRGLRPSERRAWLREHAPTGLRGHWWLALIEHAEFDASPSRALPPDQAKENLDFVVELIEMAQEEGLPLRYAATRLALVASAILKSGSQMVGQPAAVAPNNLARRILATFRLDRKQALEVASRLRATVDEDPPATSESDALQDINWLLPDLEMLEPHITDDSLARAVRQWLDVSPDLSSV
jgi:hypothetical protein